MSKLSSFFASLRLVAVAAVFCLVSSRANAADTGFDPAFNGNVNAVAIQSDGKIIVAGSFTSLQPSRDRAPFLALRIARLNPDGSTDETFGTALDGEVMTIALQPDGRILVGGKFAHAQRSVGEASVARSGLVRLERDGSIDLSFDPNPGGAPLSQAQVYALALQEDGKIVIGGGFTRLEPHRGGEAVTRSRIARLNVDGSVDAAFDPRANNLVLAFAVQRDGKILVGGGFTTFQPSGLGEVIQRQRIARLNADGTPDSEFNPRANNRVLSLAIEPNGTILLGGDFTTLHPVDEELPTTRSHLARVGPEGRVLDGDFNPRPNAAVNAIVVQRDGAIVVGGAFTQFLAQESGNAVGRAYLARLDRAEPSTPRSRRGQTRSSTRSRCTRTAGSSWAGRLRGCIRRARPAACCGTGWRACSRAAPSTGRLRRRWTGGWRRSRRSRTDSRSWAGRFGLLPA